MADAFYKKGEHVLYGVFFAAVILQIFVSISIRPILSFPETVPNVPTLRASQVQFLGDKAFAYRVYGGMIQNFGEYGGKTTALKDYNFERLSRWFFLQNELDPESNYIPFIASYLFGASQDPKKLGPIVDYLEIAGNLSKGEKWRWLAHAVYMARFQVEDYDRALELAYKLSALYKDGMPAWTAKMPAFVQLQMGEKDASYSFMRGLLQGGHEGMHPNEINFMVDYICNRLLSEEEKSLDPLCEGQ